MDIKIGHISIFALKRKEIQMKRILALILALSLVFAFAACKKTDKENESTAPETEIVTNADGEEVVVPVEDETDAEEATNADGEVVTDAEEATKAEAQTDASGKPAAKPEANKPEANKPAGKMDAAALANFLNAETAKIAKTSYNVNRVCSFTKPIDVGNKTETLNDIIHKIDANADLSSVVGGFIGVGTNKGAAKNVNSNYRIKATALKASDIQMVSASESKYVFKLANASVPQKNNGTPLARFTNDFITESEVRQGIKDALGALSALLKLEKASVVYKDITVTVNVANGKISSMSYSYNFDAVLDLKATLVPIHGTGSARTTNTFTGINY